MSRGVVKRPDGSYQTQYFDEAGQALTSVITDDDPTNTSPVPSRWVTHVVRDSSGFVTDIHSPANVTGYTHSTGTPTLSATVGLITTYTRETTGATTGYPLFQKWKEGTGDTANFQAGWTYSTSASLTVGDATVYRPVLATSKVYPIETTTDTGANTTTYTTTFYASSLAMKQVDAAQPAVSTANNGSGSAVTTKRYYAKDGSATFAKSGGGTISYSEVRSRKQIKVPY